MIKASMPLSATKTLVAISYDSAEFCADNGQFHFRQRSISYSLLWVHCTGPSVLCVCEVAVTAGDGICEIFG